MAKLQSINGAIRISAVLERDLGYARTKPFHGLRYICLFALGLDREGLKNVHLRSFRKRFESLPSSPYP